MKSANSIYAGLSTSIFEVMSRLAKEHGAINLGQGFPDTDGPEDIKRFAAEEIIASPNQYPPMMGVLELRKAVAEANRRFYGLEVDWQSEVMVTSGATEALSDCLAALIEPGDEVVLIEPLYDCYLPLVLPRRGDAALRPGDAARLADRPGCARRRLQRQDQGDPPQQPDEPGRQKSSPRTSSP